MNGLDFLKKEQILYDGTQFNAIAIPSIKNPKYIITINDKRVFFAGLNLISTRTIKAFLGKCAYSWLYRLGLIKKILKPHLVTINISNELYKSFDHAILEVEGVNIYVGSAKNENLSLTFQIIAANKEYYVRYPISQTAKMLQNNEHRNINFLSQLAKLSIQRLHKTINFQDTYLHIYEGFSPKQTRTRLCPNKMALLKCLSYPSSAPIISNVYFKELCLAIEQLIEFTPNEHIKALKKSYHTVLVGLNTVSVRKAFFHGDFSPDNVLLSKKEWHLIDFEYSHPDFFACFDLFHYFYKKNKLHLKVISRKDIQKLHHLSKIAYGELPFSSFETISSTAVIRNLFIFYLYFLLNRYLVDEKVNVDSATVANLIESISSLSNC
ncbi:phosphotransferase [Legionella sp. km772]|uniref:phosphotransferase n=1 Tax=Legionella sp. km772 TaxID=2498111 RepID=UPI000F8E8B3D|nr:phosphotransferase [Legionella sp. km772]RUR12739.1 hypothetical protein ELY15_04095 [Legionella sp. km772]